jgi:uncharacterized membrane protein YhfC
VFSSEIVSLDYLLGKQRKKRMNFHFITYPLNILFLFTIPILTGYFLVRKYDLEGSLWWFGALVYVASLIVHDLLENFLFFPAINSINQSQTFPSLAILVVPAIVIGINTGFWEVLFLYVMYRRWAKNARTWLDAILAGIGMGGAASIIVGFRCIYDLVNFSIYRNPASPIASANGPLPAELQNQTKMFWSAPWYSTFDHSVQQLFIILIMTTLSVMILLAITRRQWIWGLIAIGYETLIVAVNIITTNLLNPTYSVAALGFFAVFSVFLVLHMRSFLPLQLSSSQPVQLAADSYRMKIPKDVEDTLNDLRDPDRKHRDM